MLAHEAAERCAGSNPIMGTTVSIDVRPPLVAPSASSTTLFEQLRDVEARFSTYRPDSEISRLGRGELARRGRAASTCATCWPPATTWRW